MKTVLFLSTDVDVFFYLFPVEFIGFLKTPKPTEKQSFTPSLSYVGCQGCMMRGHCDSLLLGAAQHWELATHLAIGVVLMPVLLTFSTWNGCKVGKKNLIGLLYLKRRLKNTSLL